MTTTRRIPSVFCACLSICLSLSALQADDTAEQAWNDLVGKKMAKRPEFAFVKNDPKLPNVLIYGDSISMGYTVHVRKLLAGKANVYRTYANGGDTGRVIGQLKKMHDVMKKHWNFQWDVIHFNCGLHDLKYLGENGKYDVEKGKQVRSPEDYAKKLEEIFAYFKTNAPKAKIVFATTTPVPAKSRGRKEGDAKRFNDAALDLLKKHPEIVVNDLYALTKPKHKEWWKRPGDVHYKKQGTQAQGDKVAEVILEQLKK